MSWFDSAQSADDDDEVTHDLGCLQAVRALHQPAKKTFYVDSDCLDGGCDHTNIGPCPLGEQLVCGHCFTLGDSQSEWETSVADPVMWPCPTALAAGNWQSSFVSGGTP